MLKSSAHIVLQILLGTTILVFRGTAVRAQSKPVPDARFENVLFKTPDPAEWKRTETKEKLTFTAKAPAGGFCHIAILPGETLNGDFARAFDQAIAAHLKFLNVKIERDGGNLPSKAAEGFDVLQRQIIGRDKAGRTYHWFMGGHPGDRFDLVVFETSSDPLWNKYKPAADNFMLSVKLFNSLAPDAVAALPENLRAQTPRAEVRAKTEQVAAKDSAASSSADGKAESSGIGALLKELGGNAPKAESPAAPNMAPANASAAPASTPAPNVATKVAAPSALPPTNRAALASRPPDSQPAAIGPVHVGDTVEVSLNDNWQSGAVTHAQGLTYFVHVGDGKSDRFFQLPELRPVGSAKTFADTYHDKTPDPQGGPVAIGDTIEANVWNWIPCRVAGRVADMYVVFPEDEKIRKLKPEAWVGLSEMRAAGSTAALSDASPPPPVKPLVVKDIRIGDHVEADMPGGYGWTEGTVMAADGEKFYVQNAADSIMRAWVTLAQMRPVGSQSPFMTGK